MRVKVYNPEVVEVSQRRQVTGKNGGAVFKIKTKVKAGNLYLPKKYVKIVEYYS